ncbi:MAG: hypothetical protein ABIO69_00120 [Sphingomicrobium sp.]
METFDYLVGLFSIVVGLGLAEVAGSLNRLLRSAGLKHDPLVFGPPVLVALMLVSIWFDVWAVRRIPNLFSFPFFVAIIGQLLLLYLLAAACVPRAADQGVPLTADSYEDNRPYFWWVFAAYQLMYVGFWIFFQGKKGLSLGGIGERIFLPTGAATPLVIGLVLALTRNRLVHVAGLIVLIGWLFVGYWNYTIS